MTSGADLADFGLPFGVGVQTTTKLNVKFSVECSLVHSMYYVFFNNVS